MDPLQQQLTHYAYNITGSYEDARDVVQDVFLEVMNRPEEKIENKKAYLTRSVINRAINWKNRQKKFVSGYPGTWLPEPVATEKADTVLEQKDILSYSLMVLLEKLNAQQRAVFILKEAFDYNHDEIASLLDITEENSRKILSRAKKELALEKIKNAPKVSSEYLRKYVDAIGSRDMKQLEQLLSDDVALISDGGGKATAATKPLFGKKAVGAFVSGIYQKFYHNARFEEGMVNHHPALFYYDGDDLVTCQVFVVENGVIEKMYFVRNPFKLKALQNN
jgi:RNA polymerase sigma-70 factor (ECF subfamily)